MARFEASGKDGAVEIVVWHARRMTLEEAISPDEARLFAAALLREADKAEAVTPEPKPFDSV